MHDKRFLQRDLERDGDVAFSCLDCLCVWSGQWRFYAPLIDPDVETLTCCAGLTQTGPAHFVCIVKPALAEIAHGKMGQVEVRDGPLRRQGFRLFARHATAEEGEFIAEWPAVLCRDLAGVVPPFGAKLFMRPVIARKGVVIAFCGEPEFLCSIGGESWHNDQQTASQDQDVSEMTLKFTHGSSTVCEMKESSLSLIPCLDTRHKSPVLIRVFFNSTSDRCLALAVDNFGDHQLS